MNWATTSRQKSKRPILALAYGHTLSHVSRPLVVCEELRRRGHTVIFAGDGRELQHAARKGFDVLRIPEIPYEILFGRIRKRSLQFVKPDELKALVDADLAVMESVQPKLVLSDGRISARLSTKAASVAHAALVNVSSTHHRKEPYVPILKRFPEGPAGNRLRWLNLWLEMRVFDNAVPAFRRVASQLGLDSAVTATNCLEGNNLTLLPDLPGFMPSRGLPIGHHYVGPLLPHMDVPDPPWWSDLESHVRSGGKVLYATLGSTGAGELLGHFTQLDLTGKWVTVVTTGGAATSWCQKDKIFVWDYVNGDKVLQLASLVLCHGGNGTIYQALSHGVPILGMPTIPDQSYNMRRVEALGLGQRIQKSDLTNPRFWPEAVKNWAVPLRSPLVVQAAAWRSTSAQRAADLIEKLVWNSQEGR